MVDSHKAGSEKILGIERHDRRLSPADAAGKSCATTRNIDKTKVFILGSLRLERGHFNQRDANRSYQSTMDTAG